MLLLSVMALGITEAAVTTTTIAATSAINNSQSITNPSPTVNSNILAKSDLNDSHSLTLSPFDNGTEKSLNNEFNFDSFTNDLIEIFGDWTFNKCTTWQRPPHHIYFQLANALFLIAFLASNGESYGSLVARCALVLGSILMIMWSYLIECTFDVVVWSGSFLFVNIIYLFILVYRLRPIRFEKDIESVSFVILVIVYLQSLSLF